MQTIPLSTEGAVPVPEQAAKMYRRVLANWAGGLLRQRPHIAWAEPDPASDYRDRDWRKLYTGDILDD